MKVGGKGVGVYDARRYHLARWRIRDTDRADRGHWAMAQVTPTELASGSVFLFVAVRLSWVWAWLPALVGVTGIADLLIAWAVAGWVAVCVGRAERRRILTRCAERGHDRTDSGSWTVSCRRCGQDVERTL